MKKTYMKPQYISSSKRIAAAGACGLNTVCGEQVRCFN